MFGIKKLQKELEEEYIGEVYRITDFGNYWFQFKEHEVEQNHDNFFLIRESWHKRENIFYYSDIYNPLRRKVESRVKKTKK